MTQVSEYIHPTDATDDELANALSAYIRDSKIAGTEAQIEELYLDGYTTTEDRDRQNEHRNAVNSCLVSVVWEMQDRGLILA